MVEKAREIAARVMELRKIAGISTESAAQELGVDKAAYDRWEKGIDDIPVGVLFELAGMFKVDIAELITGEAPRLHTYCLTRADRGPQVPRRASYQYRSLAHNFLHKKAEPFLVEVGPEAGDAKIALNSHPGQEFDYVIEGRLAVAIGSHELELETGDSLYFDSSEAHGMKALGGTKARFLAIIL